MKSRYFHVLSTGDIYALVAVQKDKSLQIARVVGLNVDDRDRACEHSPESLKRTLHLAWQELSPQAVEYALQCLRRDDRESAFKTLPKALHGALLAIAANEPKNYETNRNKYQCDTI